jgi:hypothetical protein
MMIEKIQRSSNIAKTLEYLEKGNGRKDDKQLRNLYNAQGKKIDHKTANKITQMFEANDVRIYNPKTDNLTVEEMHKMAQDIVDARSKKVGEKLDFVVAIHQNEDGTNKHIHIVFMGSKQAIKKGAKGRDWINSLDAIELKYTKDEKEKKEVIEQNKKRMQSIDEKYKKGNYTGTQKADEFILKHINKKTGNFGWKRFEWALNKSKMNTKQKDYWRQRVAGRLRSLEHHGVAKSVDGQNYKIDLEKYQELRENIVKKATQQKGMKLQKNDLYKTLKEIRTQKSILYQENKVNFRSLKAVRVIAGFGEDKHQASLRIKANFSELEKLKRIEQKTKVEIIDSTLLQHGELNPDQAMIKALSQKYVSLSAIRTNITLQVARLEQLKSKGLVKKEGSSYKLAVSKEEFLKYKDSFEGAKHLDKLVDQSMPSRAIKGISGYSKEVDKWMNKWAKVSDYAPEKFIKPYSVASRFVKDIKKTYRAFRPRTTEEKFLAFGLSLAFATTKFTLKLSAQIAWKTLKTTAKAIYNTQKDLKTIRQNQRVIRQLNKTASLRRTAHTLKTQEKKIKRNYEYKMKPQNKMKEVENDRSK